MVGIALNDDSFQHPVLGMDEAIADGLAKRLMGGSLIHPVWPIQFEGHGQNLSQFAIDSLEELEKIGFPSTIRIDPVGISDAWIGRQLFPIVHKVVRESVLYGFPGTKH